MVRNHFSIYSVLQAEASASYPFFASQRSSSYVLSQENKYLPRQLLLSKVRKILK